MLLPASSPIFKFSAITTVVDAQTVGAGGQFSLLVRPEKRRTKAAAASSSPPHLEWIWHLSAVQI